jgi:exodeoxyribonuclease VII large subunit
MLRIAKKRWLLSEFYLFNVLVQGDGAAEDIAQKIRKADNFRFDDGEGFDLIIVGRGGGSKEDLWAFNERVVADAIFNASTPIISAVGHEIDYLISDFVADKRAATPSNAMEIALPDKNEILMSIDEMINAFNYKITQIILKKEKSLYHLIELFEANSIEKKLNDFLVQINFLKEKFNNYINLIFEKKRRDVENLKKSFYIFSPLNKIKNLENEIAFIRKNLKSLTFEILYTKENSLKSLKNVYESLNPQKREKEGFAEIVKNGKRIPLNKIEIDDIFFIENRTTSIKVKALERKDRK